MPRHPSLPRALVRQPAALCLLLGMTASLGAPALAQAPPDAGRLLEQSRPPALPALPPTSPPRVVEAPVRPTLSLPEGASVQASGFRVSGAASYPTATLVALLQPWVGKRLDMAGLNEAAGVLTRYYQSRGHLLTYAYVPAQRVADGVVEIAVLEGRLEAVQIVTAQEVRLRDEVVQAHTDRLASSPEQGRPVLLPEVERQMLLLNDLPGVAARAAFTPGSTTGGADMVVSVAEDEPLAMRLELDNHGARSTGEVRVGAGVQLRDVFGWGDQTHLRALVSSRGGLVSGSLGTLVPVGGDGFRIGASVSRLTYQLSGAFQALGATGNAQTLGAEVSYPFIRSADTNLSVRLAGEHKRLRDEVQLIGRSFPKRNTTLDVAVSFDQRDDWGGQSGVWAARVTASLGSLRLLDSEQRVQDAASLRTERPYSKLSAQFVRQQQLGGPFSLVLRAAAQASGGNLDSSEKFSLAGPGAVRSYAPGEASVDQGAYLGLEARFTHDYLGGSFVWGLFHERGEGRVNRLPVVATGNDVKLSGSGLSVQWNGADIGLSASMAWRGSRLPAAEGGDPKPRLYLQMVVTP